MQPFQVRHAVTWQRHLKHIYTAKIGSSAEVTPVQFRLVPPRLDQPKQWAGVAQLVERKALNLVVKGSSPFFGGCPFYTICFPTRIWQKVLLIRFPKRIRRNGELNPGLPRDRREY